LNAKQRKKEKKKKLHNMISTFNEKDNVPIITNDLLSRVRYRRRASIYSDHLHDYMSSLFRTSFQHI